MGQFLRGQREQLLAWPGISLAPCKGTDFSASWGGNPTCECHSSRPEYWSGHPFPSPGESSQPRDLTQVSLIAGGFFTS